MPPVWEALDGCDEGLGNQFRENASVTSSRYQSPITKAGPLRVAAGTPPTSPVAMFPAGARASVGARLSSPWVTRADRSGRAARRAPGSPRASAPTTGKHRRKRARRAVVLRRGHFKRLDEVERPPWSLRVDAEVHEMGMEEHDALNPEPGRGRGGNADVEDATDGERRFAAKNENGTMPRANGSVETGVVLDASVSPVGAAGFFVEGVVAASIRVECDRCGCVCVRITNTPINAWLDENAKEEDASGDWDVVPFPRDAEECDLTPMLRDVVRLDAPYETFCDACSDAARGGNDDTSEGGFVFALEPED